MKVLQLSFSVSQPSVVSLSARRRLTPGDLKETPLFFLLPADLALPGLRCITPTSASLVLASTPV